MFDTPIILFNNLCAGIPSNTHSPHLLFPCPKPRIQPRTLLIPTFNTISTMAYSVTDITLIPLFLIKNGCGDFGQPPLQGAFEYHARRCSSISPEQGLEHGKLSRVKGCGYDGVAHKDIRVFETNSGDDIEIRDDLVDQFWREVEEGGARLKCDGSLSTKSNQ